jgi:hypothetical protein
MAVTIKDVARESGVNISTVSRALNNGYGVNDETREHVVTVAARLNYRPNRVARGLVTGRTHSLALLLSDIRNPFFAALWPFLLLLPVFRLFVLEFRLRLFALEPGRCKRLGGSRYYRGRFSFRVLRFPHIPSQTPRQTAGGVYWEGSGPVLSDSGGIERFGSNASS